MGSAKQPPLRYRKRGMQGHRIQVSPQYFFIEIPTCLIIINTNVFLRFTDETMYFKGVSTTADKAYEVTLNFLHKINPDTVINKNTARNIEFTIFKVDDGPYWDSLTNDKKKPHFLKVDFNKWEDEDAETVGEDGANEGGDMDMMSNISKLVGNKYENSKPSLDDLDDQDDSDDEDLPNLE